jgi:hypothetical protein
MMSRSVRTGLVLAIASALCACNGGLSTEPSAAVIPGRASTSVARWSRLAHPDRRPSWISPKMAAAKSPLLFVSDAGTADVYIYRLPGLKLLARITGFSQPQGECSDNKGNVWVTDTNADAIYELSHSGRLENVLKSTAGHPDACAWDSTTGNLAVMTLFSGSGSSGAVMVYRKGSGTPSQYTNPQQVYYNFGGYQDGNLYFDGRDANGTFMLSELPKGAKAAHTIVLSGGTIYFPGMVQWDANANDLIVGDQACVQTYTSCLYQVNAATKTGTIAGTTDLESSSGGEVCDLVQGVEYDGEIAGSDNDFCASAAGTTYLWAYPAGGGPTNQNDHVDTTPVGATISQ